MFIMLYRKRDFFDDFMYMDWDYFFVFVYDNYVMYDNFVISGQSMWGKFYYSLLYKIKGVIILELILIRIWNLGSCVKK